MFWRINIIQTKELEDKIWFAVLAAESELLKQKQMIKSEAQKLKIKVDLAKTRATASSYDKVKLVNLE